MNKQPAAPDTFPPQALVHMDETSEAVKQNMPLWLLQADDDTAASGSKCNSQLIVLSRLVASSCR